MRLLSNLDRHEGGKYPHPAPFPPQQINSPPSLHSRGAQQAASRSNGTGRRRTGDGTFPPSSSSSSPCTDAFLARSGSPKTVNFARSSTVTSPRPSTASQSTSPSFRSVCSRSYKPTRAASPRLRYRFRRPTRRSRLKRKGTSSSMRRARWEERRREGTGGWARSGARRLSGSTRRAASLSSTGSWRRRGMGRAEGASSRVRGCRGSGCGVRSLSVFFPSPLSCSRLLLSSDRGTYSLCQPRREVGYSSHRRSRSRPRRRQRRRRAEGESTSRSRRRCAQEGRASWCRS